MNNDNVIEHQTVTWKRLKTNSAAVERHLSDARALWFSISADMVALRDDYPSDNDFGTALAQHGIEFDKNNRAAYIWMGKLTHDQLEDAMDACDRVSPRMFRQTVESWNEGYYDIKETVSQPCETDLEALVLPVEQPEVTVQPEEKQEVTKPEVKKSTAVKAEKPIEVLRKFYTSPNFSIPSIETLFKPKQRKILADLISSGVFGEANTSANPKVIAPKLFFNDYPDRWTFGNIKNGKQLFDNVEKLIEHYGKCNGDMSKSNCDQVWTVMADSDKKAKIARVNAAMVTPVTPAVSTEKRGRVPMNREDILVCGQVVWSESKQNGTEYDTAWQVYTFFKNLETHMVKDEPSVAGRARWLMSETEFTRDWWSREACNFWTVICTAQFKHATQYDETQASIPKTKAS